MPKVINLNLIFVGESYLGGMAGSKRIQNIINGLLNFSEITVSNFIAVSKAELGTENKTGIINEVKYKKEIYSKNPFILMRFFASGFFLLHSKKNQSINIVYCYDTPNLLTAPLLLFAKMLRMKVVVDLVEDYSLQEKASLGFGKKLKISVQNLLLNKIHIYTNAVLVISNYLKKNLEVRTKQKIPIYFLPITVDFNLIKKNENKNSNKFKLFYGGSFGKKDGIMFLLEAFKIILTKHKNIELILSGKPPKAGMEDVLGKIGEVELKEHVKYLGYLKDEDYYKELCNCDILCATRINSKYANAGFPFKLGEMLATANPVLTSNVGDIGNYLINKQSAIIVQPGSINEIVEGLNFLIENPEQAKKIGSSGKQVAIENFESNKITKELKEFLVTI